MTHLVMGKISYEDKMWIQTFQKIAFGYRTLLLQIFVKRVGSLAR